MDTNHESFDDFLKKAMESEYKVDDENDESIDKPEIGKFLASILEQGSLIKLGRAAIEKKKQLIDELSDFLSNNRKKEGYEHDIRAAVKIIRAAKALSILDTITASASIYSMTSLKGEADASNVLDRIIKTNMLL